MSSKAVMKPGPHLNEAIAIIREAIGEVEAIQEQAVRKAMHVGAVLLEVKARLPHGAFQPWIEENFGANRYRNLARWMEMTERVLLATGLESHALPASLAEIVAPESSGLSTDALAARQLLFDFTNDKTIRDCLAGVVEGDAAHRITRAHNGRTKGGHDGGDRKDFPKFIGVHLSDITSHLKFFKSFTGAMVEIIEAKFKAAIAKWPTSLLETLKKLITDELKTR